MNEPVKVLIVDDHPLVREGLVARLGAQHHLDICGEAEDVDAALALLDATGPDLMVADLTLKSGHGLDLIKKASKRYPDLKILVVSAHDDELFAERALRAGAVGYVNKQEAQNTVLDAVSAVLRGEHYVSGDVARHLIGRAIGDCTAPAGVESLSDRELEIFEFIGRGRSTRAIAEELHLSVHTIETHRENIRAKLNLRNGTELVRYAVQWVLESRNGW